MRARPLSLSLRCPLALLAPLCATLAALAALLAPRAALAALDLTARASAREVEVGEVFALEIKATVEQDSELPSDPQLRPPAEISIVGGPSISTGTFAQFGGGVSSVRRTFSATWNLTAGKPGSFVIPAPSVEWNGRRERAAPVPITVVAATGRPRQQRPSFPFLLPGGPTSQFPWPFGGQNPFDDVEPEEDDDAGAAELAMPAAPDATVFLRAIPDKTTAVVGEQVSLSFYLYYRDVVEMNERHDAPMSDFVRVPLMRTPGAESTTQARVGGQRWMVRPLDRIALFPLKAGQLHTGSMTSRFSGRRLGSRVLRSSNDVVIQVTEPPAAGRPPGYQIGDVGSFTLSAAVQPRKIDQGGSLSVSVKLTGSGNFPQSLRIPERTGIEWLDPEKREQIEPRGGVIAGWRTFGYVVRVEQSGQVDLGAVELSFWNPAEKRYVVERAPLGVVEVTPVTPVDARPSGSSSPSPGASPADRDPFATLPAPRAAMAAYAPPAPPRLSGGPLYALLASPPLLVVLFGVGERLRQRARDRRAAGASAADLAAEAQRAAQEAAARGDVKETAAAAERAVHRAIEASTGLRSRGVLLDALPDELADKGVDRGLAQRAREVLADCAAIRFDPTAGATAAAELADRARAVTADLARRKPT